MATKLDVANHLYTTLKFSIFPTSHKSKAPAIPHWKPFQSERAPLHVVTAHYTAHPLDGIAIVTGKISNLSVLDIDPHEDANEKDLHSLLTTILNQLDRDTLVVKTGSGGYHIYLQYIPNKRTSLQLPSTLFDEGNDCARIDIKAEGGYVIGPTSTHPNGNEYVVSTTYSLPLDELTSSQDLAIIPKDSKLHDLIYNEARATLDPSEWQKIMTTNQAEGSRNMTMTRIAGLLLSKFHPDYWATLVLPLLQSYNTTHCDPPLSSQEVDRIFNSIGKKQLENLFDNAL